MQSFITTIFDDRALSPWNDSPPKTTDRYIFRKIKRPAKSNKLKFSPYKQPYVNSRLKANKRSESIITDVIANAPARTKNFPTRKANVNPIIMSRRVIRSHSCRADKISIFDIENIERLQKLVPFKATSSNFFKNRRPSLPSSLFLVSPRTTSLSYKKYIKQLV